MPNWCMNYVEVKTSNSDLLNQIRQFEQAPANSGLFDLIAPMPPELLEATYPNTPEDVAARNVAKYGFPTWYEFADQNWGTKWNVQRRDVDITFNDDGFVLRFDTAWSPPINALERMGGLENTSLKGYYAEPGCGFAGIFDSEAGDTTIEYSDEDFKSEPVNPLLSRLDDLFCLYDPEWYEDEDED